MKTVEKLSGVSDFNQIRLINVNTVMSDELDIAPWHPCGRILYSIKPLCAIGTLIRLTLNKFLSIFLYPEPLRRKNLNTLLIKKCIFAY